MSFGQKGERPPREMKPSRHQVDIRAVARYLLQPSHLLGSSHLYYNDREEGEAMAKQQNDDSVIVRTRQFI